MNTSKKIVLILAQFWHDDVRIVRDQNRVKHRRDLPQLMDLWRTMVLAGTSPSKDQTEEETQPKRRVKPDIVLARKLRNLQDFAKVYHLDLNNDDDRCLKTDRARENVRRMARDLLTSITETNERHLDQLVVQMSLTGNYHRPVAHQSKLQTYYQEMLEVMPQAWKNIFEEERGKSI